ncbi:MAG: methylenetetrahydrofolate reductase [NAD(P)H] [FCB group bacterium]|nr:methylenetetrahydrofolate reductase [NAD(P)H] [FCB group bacterium]
MKVIEHLEKATAPLFSFEIIPPVRGKSAKEILDIVEQLQPYTPPFIDVTSHSAEAYYEETDDGSINRRIRKKRPGTISICGIIQNRFNIDTVAHLLCRGFSKEETEDAVIELNYLGIHNVLVIRGDETNYKKPVRQDRSINLYAADLVKQVNHLRQGAYLEDIINADPIDMCVGVGGYPEKHFEAPNLKTDIQYLKKKIDAGADYIVTQMFFDNRVYFDFVDRCRKAGIQVPIIPGIKLLDNPRQLRSIPRSFHINLPDDLVDEVMENPDHCREIGMDWCKKQSEELLNSGVSCIHYYILNDTSSVRQVLDKLRS